MGRREKANKISDRNIEYKEITLPLHVLPLSYSLKPDLH
jgi:hypothetical protein